MRRGQRLSAKRTDTERPSDPRYQGRAFPFYRHLSADGLTCTLAGLPRTEEACPSVKPLVESVHATSLVLAANVATVAR